MTELEYKQLRLALNQQDKNKIDKIKSDCLNASLSYPRVYADSYTLILGRFKFPSPELSNAKDSTLFKMMMHLLVKAAEVRGVRFSQ